LTGQSSALYLWGAMGAERRTLRQSFDSELGDFVEEICADLCRLESAAAAGCDPAEVSVERELALGADTFADIRVAAPGTAPFFVENKLAYTPGDLADRLRRKYGQPSPAWRGAQRVSVLLDLESTSRVADLERELRTAVAPGLAVELWGVADLFARIRAAFDHDITDLSPASLLGVREAIERAHWRRAFDGKFPDDPRAATLLWHLSPWELARLHREAGLSPADILEPRTYRGVVIVMADLCAFTSYVHDTRDSAVMRRRLTEYYSLARHAVLNAGGMLYQFVGDEVVGVFGLHRLPGTAAVQALTCVRSLFTVGTSVSRRWQRAIDRVQPSMGVHIGLAMGDIDLMPFRPFSRTHLGFMGEALNLAGRLMTEATADQAVATNTFYMAIDETLRRAFEAIGPVEAKNVGRIHGWRTTRAALELPWPSAEAPHGRSRR
jgi:class 3 adenylate cyclase